MRKCFVEVVIDSYRCEYAVVSPDLEVVDTSRIFTILRFSRDGIVIHYRMPQIGSDNRIAGEGSSASSSSDRLGRTISNLEISFGERMIDVQNLL
jgi:hypothetical protein